MDKFISYMPKVTFDLFSNVRPSESVDTDVISEARITGRLGPVGPTNAKHRKSRTERIGLFHFSRSLNVM